MQFLRELDLAFLCTRELTVFKLRQPLSWDLEVASKPSVIFFTVSKMEPTTIIKISEKEILLQPLSIPTDRWGHAIFFIDWRQPLGLKATPRKSARAQYLEGSLQDLLSS